MSLTSSQFPLRFHFEEPLMAQQPQKLVWKHDTPYGLSASQFGMALGFCGRVSDYIDYLRNIVGTGQEFSGNACTAHGINTEAKARGLYEALTGNEVHDGGFFLSQDRLLGCSPDGQSFYYEAVTPCPPRASTNSSMTFHQSTCSFKIPFRRPQRSLENSDVRLSAEPMGAVSCSPDTTAQSLPTVKCKLRLLEIKSPFRALYASNRPNCQPYGIPLQYMCQIQGQMAIADAEECDFFVYLDEPCQVEAWRVKRSPVFWRWAEPKLLQVVEWVRDGPPPLLGRSFEFEPFDFSLLHVQPLVFPFCLSSGKPLCSSEKYAFFAGFENPYADVLVHTPCISEMRTEAARIANAVRSPAIQFLFVAADTEEPSTSQQQYDDEAPGSISFQCTALGLSQELGRWNSVFSEDAELESRAADCVAVHVSVPENWDAGEVHVRVDASQATQVVRLYKRHFFSALVPFRDRSSTSCTALAALEVVAAADTLLTTPRTQTMKYHEWTLKSLQTPPMFDSAGESLSQRIRLQLTPVSKKHAANTSNLRATNDLADTVQPMQRIGYDDLVHMLQDTEECATVFLLSSLQQPLRTYWKADPISQDVDTFTLIVAEGGALEKLLHAATLADPHGERLHSWHRSVLQLVKRLHGHISAPPERSGSDLMVFVAIHDELTDLHKTPLPSYCIVTSDVYGTLRHASEFLSKWSRE